jgi:hypothetical protein
VQSTLTPEEAWKLRRVWNEEHEQRTGLSSNGCRPLECSYADEPEGS